MTPKELQRLRKAWEDTKKCVTPVEEEVVVTPLPPIDKNTILSALNRIKEREMNNIKGGKRK